MKNKDIEEYKPEELEDRMHRYGHTDFQVICAHHLFKEEPSFDHDMPIKICISCGKKLS